MKEAGEMVPEELKRTTKFAPTEQQLQYSTYESDDVLFFHATQPNRLWGDIYQRDGTEHHPGNNIHNFMKIGTQKVFNDTIYELGQHHADTVLGNGNVIARNKNNSFRPLGTSNTPAKWSTSPEAPRNPLQRLHSEERMYLDDQLEVHNSNARFANTRGGQVTSNKSSYDANHRTGQREGRMQAVGMSNRQISRSPDLSFPLGPLAEEDLGEFSTMTQEEYENINKLINESFDESSRSVLEFTEADQALLDAMEAENSESSLTRYPYQPSLSGDFLQGALVLTAQGLEIQNTDYLQETGTTHHPLQHVTGCPVFPEDEPVPSHHSPKKSAIMPYPLAAMMGSTTMQLPTANDYPTHYQKGSLSPMCADSQSPMNHNWQITGNYQPSTPLPSPGIHRPFPVVDFQHLSASVNVAGAAQNKFEHDPLCHKPESGGYNGAVNFQANDIGAYPTPPYDSYTPPESPHRDPAMTNYAENNLGAGGEMQQTYYRPMNAEKSVVHGTKNGITGKNGERVQTGEKFPRSKKRPDWATRPDAVRPRVSMTEEEYQWLRPGKPARDIFATARRKADNKRMREEAMADAMERAGKPRPKPKKPMPIKGGVHIEEWEKEKLNEYRKSRGMSGRSLFMAKPQTHGKRKACEVAGPVAQQEPKQQRLSENGDDGFGTINGVNEEISANVSPWNRLDPAHSLVENGIDETLSGLATEDGRVSWFPGSTDLLNGRQGNLQDFDNLIDPRLLSLAQFPYLEK
ncbi:3944b0fd-0490-4da8-ad0f-afba4aa5f343 [Sclerotinia trifoliorum]|uniref:3944b0fd-0490-4da8-ad0f-afba4aa5f343 n=1 Tax=Sclerotinia trifoliorum TaxID=28548 RepID=A0A8H2W3Y4_9HELO|nr:3944b0fd-0490-4da8-ad0f-afba4aa5f343 [Sclerotinia trifoliorum]